MIAVIPLDALKAAIAALNGGEGDPASAELELRGARRELAREFLGAQDACALYAGAAGERHRALVHSGLRDLGRDEEDAVLAASIEPALGQPGPKGDGALLAAMLFFHA